MLQGRLRALFEAEGFRCDALTVRRKTVENRALDLRMPRRWIQAVFTYVGGPAVISGAAEVAQGRSIDQLPTDISQTDSHLDERALSSEAPTASQQHASAGATGALSSCNGTAALGAATVEAACPPDDGCEHSSAYNEWDASPEEGVLGSEVGGMFQEPLEMVREAIPLGPGLTVEARAAPSLPDCLTIGALLLSVLQTHKLYIHARCSACHKMAHTSGQDRQAYRVARSEIKAGVERGEGPQEHGRAHRAHAVGGHVAAGAIHTRLPVTLPMCVRSTFAALIALYVQPAGL